MQEIIERYAKGEIGLEEALEGMSTYCPNLLNDDNGHWALAFDGMQSIPLEEGAEDIETFFFVEAKYWKDTIREAILAHADR